MAKKDRRQRANEHNTLDKLASNDNVHAKNAAQTTAPITQ
jgi:hypothetical protein